MVVAASLLEAELELKMAPVARARLRARVVV